MGLALGIPLTALALFALLSAVGPHDVDVSLGRIARMAAIFAGFPAFLSGGGVARLVAHRLAEAGPGTRRGLTIGAFAMAVAGAGLAYLTAVPVGGLPPNSLAWGGVAGVGAISGAITGLAIGALVGMRMSRHQKPKEA